MSDELNPMATTSVAIASNPLNIKMIVQSAPESYETNKLSKDRCASAGENLLEVIQRDGMSDELDQKVAMYIDKTRKTVKVMNERRAPVTKLFDQIRTEFTSMENAIDPSKAGTIPYKLQQHRNQYAAKKREEEEARRRAEEAARQAQIARSSYRTACIDDYKIQFNNFVVSNINQLTDLNSSITLDNYSCICDTVSAFATELPEAWAPKSSVRMPYNLTPEESRSIASEALQSLIPQFKEQFRFEIGEYRQDILDRLPSKRVELEKAAKASAEEAQRIATAMKEREEAELSRKERERALREAEETRRKEVEKAATDSVSLFDISASKTQYTPKTKVSKKIRIVSPDGYMQCLAMWWSKEGSRLSDEELAKAFKKQVSFCEKLANKDGEFIKSESIEYVDDVKAQ